MAGQFISDARRLIRDRYGAAVEEKASDTFCLEQARRVSGGPLEGGVAAQPTVLEFAGGPSEAPAQRARVFAGVADQLDPASRTRVLSALRREAIVRQRDEFDRAVGGVRARLEAAGRGRTFQWDDGETAVRPPALVETCWLNRTVRALSDRNALADVAADPTLERIDVARPLTADLHETPRTVGAPAYRRAHEASGKGIIVAVIDSEVALTHPALAGRIVHKDNYTREAWGNPGDHGTAVAGIVGSSDDGFPGIAPEATIYNYKVIATDSALNADDFGGALALQQALEDGVQVANCSWGTGPARDGTSRESRACDAAWANGLAIVKSAGNRGPGAQTLTIPADADGVIVVGATNRNGRRIEDYSSRGPTPGGLARPHLVAPGGEETGAGITSCLVDGTFGDTGCGTSYAAPHVTGLVALILQAHPDLEPDELRCRLLEACTSMTGVSHAAQGAGLVVLV
jgi:serine protease AprX